MASPPTNTSPTTATVIPTGRLPYTQLVPAGVVDLAPTGSGYASTCDATQYRAMWWTYTTAPWETYLTITADAPGAVNYRARYSVWSMVSGVLTQFTLTGPTQNFCAELSGGDTWANLPVSANTRYWFQITDTNALSAVDANLTIQLKAGPQVAAPAGSIVIKDDDDGYRTMVMTVDGTMARALPFPAGEWADTLATGETATVDGTANVTVVVYNGTLTSVLGTHTFANGLKGIKSNRSSAFYAITQNASDPLVVTELGPTAIPTGRTWTLPADSATARSFAVNQASTRFYYGPKAASAVVHAYDLTNSAALPDLHVAFTTELLIGAADGFTLADGSIFFGYGADANGATGKVRRFDTSGTVLNTYTLTSGNFLDLNHLCYYDETSFLVWGFTSLGQGTSVFRRIKISDGTTIGSDVEVPTYGTSGSPFTSSTGFGVSNSCPLFTNPSALEPPIPPLPGPDNPFPPGTPVDVPIRRLRRAPVLNSDGKWLFLKRFELDADVGHGAVTGQGQDPKVQLRISRDGGQTFGNIHTVSAGRLGQYRQRIRFLALGSGRNIVVEVVVSDPIAWAFYQAFADLAEGVS